MDITDLIARTLYNLKEYRNCTLGNFDDLDPCTQLDYSVDAERLRDVLHSNCIYFYIHPGNGDFRKPDGYKNN